jgi:hypothetical protein
MINFYSSFAGKVDGKGHLAGLKWSANIILIWYERSMFCLFTEFSWIPTTGPFEHGHERSCLQLAGEILTK